MISSQEDSVSFSFGPWETACLPRDGGRISSLRYGGIELFTKAPKEFRAPGKDYGRYELRPVYGYDDCFPSVASCAFPEGGWTIPDHGELCWLSAQLVLSESILRAVFFSEQMPLVFVREMIFGQTNLEWHFSVLNYGSKPLPFQHVMHPLMPPDIIDTAMLPSYQSITDLRNPQRPHVQSRELWQTLQSMPEGGVAMLLLRGISDGCFTLDLKAGIRLRVTFDHHMFPTLGIWWNRGAYPDEAGCRRWECAFEPIPGSTGSLPDDYDEKSCPVVFPRRVMAWNVVWAMESPGAG